jgi:hypothetical protein
MHAKQPFCSDMAQRTVSILTRRSTVATVSLKTDVKCRRFHFYKRSLCNIVVLSRSASCCLTAINTSMLHASWRHDCWTGYLKDGKKPDISLLILLFFPGSTLPNYLIRYRPVRSRRKYVHWHHRCINWDPDTAGERVKYPWRTDVFYCLDQKHCLAYYMSQLSVLQGPISVI